MNKAIFLDRDGVIIKNHKFVTRINDIEFIEKSLEAILLLKQKGYLIFIITNQAGIAFGHITSSKVDKLNNFISEKVKTFGANIDNIYSCPYLHSMFKCNSFFKNFSWRFIV